MQQANIELDYRGAVVPLIDTSISRKFKVDRCRLPGESLDDYRSRLFNQELIGLLAVCCIQSERVKLKNISDRDACYWRDSLGALATRIDFEYIADEEIDLAEFTMPDCSHAA